uniref:Uncharacterized protein n=1 Tax=Eutreptiella gymnastica TaxID=73025 RepID=A0A7S1ISR2_9EUGL|mmetsp:Transcript_40727/g.72886  ORF Transcript_40727/g.72886 Transcript_40727/m.72886 type:complete len:105 (+) Transcript_40727:183-497(+)
MNPPAHPASNMDLVRYGGLGTTHTWNPMYPGQRGPKWGQTAITWTPADTIGPQTSISCALSQRLGEPGTSPEMTGSELSSLLLPVVSGGLWPQHSPSSVSLTLT